MSDRIRLSLWFKAQTQAQLLPRLADASEVLPQETLERGVQQYAVVALDWSEPALLEEAAEEGLPVAQALEAMREFVHDDCACQIELAWMLWSYGGGAWRQTPHPLRLISLGAQFASGSVREDGDLTVDFGLDEAFLADLAPWNRETRQHLQANIVQLLVYCHKLQHQLRPFQRRLWSENESDWTEKLTRRLKLAAAEDVPGQVGSSVQ
ncbi:MAG: hypothetical protein ACRD1C_07190 [Terriglobales bacterium]